MIKDLSNANYAINTYQIAYYSYPEVFLIGYLDNGYGNYKGIVTQPLKT